MIVKKITTGSVIQEFDTESGKFISQQFICGDQVEWSDEAGETMLDSPSNAYLPFRMVQPENMENDIAGRHFRETY